MSDDNLPAVAQSPSTEIMQFIRHAVSDPSVDVGKLRELLAIHKEVRTDAAVVSFNRALHIAQSEMPSVEKRGTVTLGSNKGSYAFATWEDMDKVLRPIMDRHGFSLSFDMQQRVGDGGGAIITGTLSHVDGHSKSASIPLALDSGPGRNATQAMGSTMSYGRRYCAEMLFNIVRKGIDDDGKLGGTKFIGEDEVTELVDLCKEAGREESTFLDRMFAGTVRSFDEIEAGGAYIAVKNTLSQIIHQKKAKA